MTGAPILALAVPPAAFTSFILILRFAGVWTFLDRGLHRWLVFTGAVLVGLHAAAGAAAFLALHRSLSAGVCYYVLVLTSSLCVPVASRWARRYLKPPAWLVMLPVATPAVLIAGVIAYTALPYVASSAKGPGSAPTEPSGTQILQSVERVRLLVDTVEQGVSIEADNIDRLLDDIVEELDRKNRELQATQGELERLSRELEYYRAVASLSEEEAQAVLDTFAAQIRSERQLNAGITFGIGLLTGVLSSLAVHGALRVGAAILGQTPPPEGAGDT